MKENTAWYNLHNITHQMISQNQNIGHMAPSMKYQAHSVS